MTHEADSSSGDDYYNDSDDNSSSSWRDVFEGFQESDKPNRSAKARDVLNMILKNYAQGLFPKYAETQEYLQQSHPDVYTTHHELLDRVLEHIGKADNTVSFEFYALGADKPFSRFVPGDNTTGPARIFINTDHHSVDYTLDEVHLPSVIELFSSLVAAQVYIEQNPYFNQDKELIYSELRTFLETPYFVSARIQLDEESWGAIDIDNSENVTKIIFPYVGYESSVQRSRELRGNQTYYLKGEEKIKFFRFLLDTVPFSAPFTEDPEGETLEGITIPAEDDFLPAPRLQLTRKEFDVDDYGQRYVFKTETMYMDLSDDNRVAIIKTIQAGINKNKLD